MRWGIRRQHAAPSARCEEDDGGERGSKAAKGKAFSFSPLSWLAKLAPKEKPGAGAAAKRAPALAFASTPKNTAAAAAPAFPSSCLPKRTSPSPAAVTVTPGSSSFSPPRRSTADAVVPRRRSVGNDNADDSVAMRRQSCRHSHRHCSVGGERELPPLGRLIPFSLLAGGGSPARAAAAPSDTDAAGARARRHRRRRSSRRVSVSGDRNRRPSISGRMPPPRVRFARSPRRGRAAAVAPAELDGLAVVRRTRDPQRAFRESMVEMIASASGGEAAVPPRPEELERLLACYLSLNADEHHDCIVKVFRQVWFEYVSLLPLRPESRGRRRRPPTTATARRC